MSSWGNNDNAANTPVWAAASVNLRQNRTNVTGLFDNTTVGYFEQDLPNGGARQANVAIGVFGVDAQESEVESGSAHTGWVLRKSFTGGRAGRVQEEVLVAMNTINYDSDGQVYANVTITLSNPGTASVVSGAANANSVTFTVTPTLTGNTAANLTYQWQVNAGGQSWVNMTNGTGPQPGGVGKTGVTTNAVTITPWNNSSNNYVYRLVVTAADEGVVATSANAQIVIF